MKIRVTWAAEEAELERLLNKIGWSNVLQILPYGTREGYTIIYKGDPVW